MCFLCPLHGILYFFRDLLTLLSEDVWSKVYYKKKLFWSVWYVTTSYCHDHWKRCGTTFLSFSSNSSASSTLLCNKLLFSLERDMELEFYKLFQHSSHGQSHVTIEIRGYVLVTKTLVQVTLTRIKWKLSQCYRQSIQLFSCLQII